MDYPWRINRHLLIFHGWGMDIHWWCRARKSGESKIWHIRVIFSHFFGDRIGGRFRGNWREPTGLSNFMFCKSSKEIVGSVLTSTCRLGTIGKFRVLGWESVCWGVLGIPLLENCWISKICQDSTILKFRLFWKVLGEDDCFGPKKIKIMQTYSIVFPKYIWFNRT